MARQIARERNDRELVQRVEKLAREFKSGLPAEAEEQLREAEKAVGIDPGGWSMAGQPLFHPTAAMASGDAAAVREITRAMEGAPHHLFLGERFVLRKAPDAVLKAVGKHVDVFSMQAIILSRHRPPESQRFQADGWDHEMKMTGRPILVVDWAAPFSLGAAFDTERGTIKSEAEAAEDSAKWLAAALAHPDIVGVFRCQLIGTRGNDRWFEGKAKRTYLRDHGTPFPEMAAKVSAANKASL